MVLEKASGYVAAQEAARMLGVNQRAVRNLIARGRLETKRDGGGATGRPLVCVASLERLRSER
jgi:predicted ArsR family transcriptional regulator